MLTASDTNLEAASVEILNAGFDVAFIVPTNTAMKKSIMDAHASLRAFLKRNEIHDYDEQPQDIKQFVTAQYIAGEQVIEKTVSLYRSETKNGDPRIWTYGLKTLANSYSLLALIHSKGQLLVANCSTPSSLSNALDNIIPRPTSALSETA